MIIKINIILIIKIEEIKSGEMKNNFNLNIINISFVNLISYLNKLIKKLFISNNNYKYLKIILNL